MDELAPMTLARLIDELTQLRDAHGSACVWLPRRTGGDWVGQVTIDPDGDVVLHGCAPYGPR